MNKTIFKKILPYIVAISTFILLTLIYASPILDGKVVNAGDTKGWEGMYQECKEYNESGNYSWWTGSMFGGMPTYQIGGGKYPTPAIDINFAKIIRLGLNSTLAIIFSLFLGYFILLRAFKINEWLSIVGAIAIALSSYFILIIPAGHNTKATALGFLPVILGGLHLIYQKRYGIGAILTMVYTSISLMSHPQMTYYIFMLIGVIFCAELYIHIREKRWKDLGISTLIFILAFGIGLGVQITPFMANQEYAKETMRGGHSELTTAAENDNHTDGLSLSYMTQYSYGIGETSTLLIPGARGYASAYNVGTNSKLYDTMIKNGVPRRNAAAMCEGMPTYWGGDEGTSGPVYVGAIVCFLFILGLIIVKGPYKWALLIATLFSIVLSWGYNFMPPTELFAKYFPMYTKFRAVESILVVAEITIPLLGFLALKEIMDQKSQDIFDSKKLIKQIYIATGITAGLCIIALFASFIHSYEWGRDESIFAQWPEWLSNAIIAERATIYRTSAFRSLIFVLIGSGLVWLYAANKLKFSYFVASLGIFILIDMWPIDRKFFNESHFVSQKQDKSYFAEQPWETDILTREKNNLSYRVYNLTNPQGPFNDSRTSYRFKSIGGYNAAKLRRYQDLIDAHISEETNPMIQSIQQIGNKLSLAPNDSTGYPVLNMLNMKYAIVGNEQPFVVENPNAFGNAWFVDSVVIVNTPIEESNALKTINLHNTLVTDIKFQDYVKNFTTSKDTTATIQLTKYAPDYVEYDYQSSSSKMVVFSEIYYPYGWNAYIDGAPADHFRANYTLRAMQVPAGKHHIRFEFRPKTIEKWGKVSIICKSLMILLIIGIASIGCFQLWKKNPKHT